MKKMYQAPIFQTVTFMATDVITASIQYNGYGDDKQWSYLGGVTGEIE